MLGYDARMLELSMSMSFSMPSPGGPKMPSDPPSDTPSDVPSAAPTEATLPGQTEAPTAPPTEGAVTLVTGADPPSDPEPNDNNLENNPAIASEKGTNGTNDDIGPGGIVGITAGCVAAVAAALFVYKKKQGGSSSASLASSSEGDENSSATGSAVVGSTV